MRTFPVVALLVSVSAFGIGCKKEEVKTEPPAPAYAEPAAVQAAAPGAPAAKANGVAANGATVTNGTINGAANPNGATVTVNAGGVVANAKAAGEARTGAAQARNTANAVAPPGKDVTIATQDGRSIVRKGDKVTMQAADGRTITTNANGEVFMEDPSRPGAKIKVDGAKVTAGAGSF